MRRLTLYFLALGISSCPSSGGSGSPSGPPSPSTPPVAVSVEMGGEHGCALLSNARVHCWGRGHFGQLGYGNESNRNTPGEAIPGLADVAQISAGFYHTCALTSGGSVHCWGSGGSGRLGHGDTSDRNLTGSAIPGLSDVTQISAGGEHTCALVTNGDVHCWGKGESNRLGYGNTVDRTRPGGPIPNLTNVVQVSAGNFHTCAVVANGSAHCWGHGHAGALGYGDESNRLTPGDPIPGLSNVTQIVASLGSVSCVVFSNASATCWGNGQDGRHGQGGDQNILSPGDVFPDLNVSHISSEGNHVCALTTNGSVHCWGTGSDGQLGYGNNNKRSTPGEPIPGLGNVTVLSVGNGFSCVVIYNGSVRCWGTGASGRLGYGNSDALNRPGGFITF